jgi:hypothetical protein
MHHVLDACGVPALIVPQLHVENGACSSSPPRLYLGGAFFLPATHIHPIISASKQHLRLSLTHLLFLAPLRIKGPREQRTVTGRRGGGSAGCCGHGSGKGPSRTLMIAHPWALNIFCKTRVSPNGPWRKLREIAMRCHKLILLARRSSIRLGPEKFESCPRQIHEFHGYPLLIDCIGSRWFESFSQTVWELVQHSRFNGAIRHSSG